MHQIGLIEFVWCKKMNEGMHISITIWKFKTTIMQIRIDRIVVFNHLKIMCKKTNNKQKIATTTTKICNPAIVYYA